MNKLLKLLLIPLLLLCGAVAWAQQDSYVCN